MRKPLHRLAAFMLAATAGSGALAFTLLGLRWPEPTATFKIGMTGAAPSGATWSSALTDAMTAWNDATDFTFVADPSYTDPCTNITGINRIDFRPSVCGSSFGSSVLAVTLTLANPGQLGFGELYQSNILFNTKYTWDVYDGPRRNAVDFRRVALHEFGHAIGLDHENTQPAIMASSITDMYTLQADDIAGVNSIYNGTGACLVRDVSANVTRSDSLITGDCRVQDLFGGTDTSFVDVYRLRLERTTTLDIRMSSSELDSVLILTNPNLGNVEIFDDFGGQCDARLQKALPAGEYRLLANTYVTPEKCAGNTGGYHLTISDSGMPVLGGISNALGGTMLANAVITGGATADRGVTFATNFTQNQNIDVLARIVPDALHVGRTGKIYVLVTVSDGRQFMKNESGQFVPYSGGIANLVPMRTGVLTESENVSVVSGFRAMPGLAGQTLSVYVGYALFSDPQQIWYGNAPIRFTIAP